MIRQDVTVIQGVEDPTQTQVAEPQQIVPVDDFGPKEGWEFNFAAKHNILYPAVRTLGDLIPFGFAAFPSGRKEFDTSSIAKQAALLAMDAAVALPGEWIGKGLKAITHEAVKVPLYPIKKGLKALNIAERAVEETSPKVLDGLMRKLDEFVYRTPVQGLMKKYGLSEREAIAASEGRSKVWLPAGRSGAQIESGTEGLSKLFTKKGKLAKKVEKDLAVWKKPYAEQRLAFYKQEWERYFGHFVSRSEYTPEQLFAGQARKLFGEKVAKDLTLENIGEKDFQKLLLDGLLNERKILRHVDISWGSYGLPVRKVAGAWNKLYGTFDRLYQPIKEVFTAKRLREMEDIHRFHLIQAARGLGKITKRGAFKPAYGGAEWREAGKLIRTLDNLQGSGAPQEALQSVLNKASEPVQKLVKSYQEWTDYMYADDVKNRIARAFASMNPTPTGWDAFDTLMSPYGRKLGSYITEIFAASNNLSYEQKVKAFTRVLDEMKKKVFSNPHWFFEPDKASFQNFAKELSFRKAFSGKGLPSYLDNYGARIFEEGTPRYTKQTTRGVSANPTPGFVKGRTQEVAPEATEDLNIMIGTRVRQQSKDIIVTPHLAGWKEEISKLPKNLRTYFTHYLSRMLGQASPADEKVALWINRVFGTNWSGARVKQLAYTINDLVYLGGIGFKPFSAMRNLLQPILLVPGDLGGIKDVTWLVKGYQRGLSGQGMQYLREIGAITEYAPDLLFQAQISKFGKTLQLAGKEFTPPSLRRVRDAGMWMFKMSDQLNRYVSGGAAMSKWEYYVKKLLMEDGGLSLNGKTIEKFIKKLNLSSRDPWIRDQITSKLRSFTRTGLEEAKKVYVKDVVADTQFLYGAADSPLVAQAGGSVAKNALVFQSWWMNYGAELQKWLIRSGSVDEAAQRMFTWMVSSAVVYAMIKPIWGKQTGKRAVFTGPFPLSVDIPATWRPMRDGLNTILTAGQATLGMSDLDAVKKKIVATLKSSMIYVPGGIQGLNLARGASKEGFPGFMKEIIRYRPATS